MVEGRGAGAGFYGPPLTHTYTYIHTSSCQLEITLRPAAQLLLSQSQQGDLVGHHLQLPNVREKISRPICDRFMRQILPTMNRKPFFMNILALSPFVRKKTHNIPLLFGSTPWVTVVIVTTESIIWTCACASGTKTVMKLDCAAT
jgi:hypothetical protein